MRKDQEDMQDREKDDNGTIKKSDVEGYGYCATDKQKCMQDCNGTPFISTLN